MADQTPENDSADLLYGMPAIAMHLHVRPRQAYHMAEKGGLPTFKIAGKMCARRSSLNAWLAEQEAKGSGATPE